MDVRLHIGAELTVTGLPQPVADELIRRNTFANPEYARKERLGLWTGTTNQTIALYRYVPSGLVVPRGTLPLIIKLCQDRGITAHIDDRTIAPALNVALRPGTLFNYQRRALNDLLRTPTGMLEGVTGCGKTNILLSAIPLLKTTTLILTHTKELLAQTAARCREWLHLEPGIIGAGKWELRPITVAMIQTLVRRDLREVSQYFGCVLVDECHHSPARTWAAILNELPARFRYGVTATAWRKDGLQFLMWRTLGDVTATINAAEVTRAGTIITPEIETVQTDFLFDLEDATDWTRMITALVQDDARNDLIADEVRVRQTPSSRTLILTDRIEHVHALAHRLSDCNPIVLTGELGKSARDTAMAGVRQGASLTIATSSLLGEGVDVPGWDLLFLATPMAGGPRTLQAVGRVSRAAPGKDCATVVDFVDTDVPALLSAHALRVRLYRRDLEVR
jgi:superfamily II DNA or RNA helicase